MIFTYQIDMILKLIHLLISSESQWIIMMTGVYIVTPQAWTLLINRMSNTIRSTSIYHLWFNSSVFQVLPISLNILILWSLEGLCNLD